MNPINKIFIGVAAAAGLVIVLAFFWLSLANAHLKAQLAEAQTQKTAYMMANDAFADKIVEQNRAVEKLKADAAEREKRAKEAAEEAQEKARIFYVAAEKLSKMKPRGEACTAANALFNAYLRSQK